MKSNADYADDYVRRLQESVEYIKTNREMEARYMLWKELYQLVQVVQFTVNLTFLEKCVFWSNNF